MKGQLCSEGEEREKERRERYIERMETRSADAGLEQNNKQLEKLSRSDMV